jgi:hypothetical protein
MKTIRYLIAALLLCNSFAAPCQDAQQNKPSGVKGYLAFSGGVSLPQADYNSTTSSTFPGGYANTGGNFSFSLDLTPAHFPLGIAVSGGYYFNRFDYNNYLNHLQAADVSSTYGTNQPNANALFYSGFYGMAGLCKEIALSKIAFDFRALAGDMSIATPEIYYYATQPSSSLFSSSTERSWDISNAKGSAFAYNLGITARVRRTLGADVFVSVDYINSQIPSSTTVLYTDADGKMSSYVNNTTLAVSFFIFSIGFGYDLGD